MRLRGDGGGGIGLGEPTGAGKPSDTVRRDRHKDLGAERGPEPVRLPTRDSEVTEQIQRPRHRQEESQQGGISTLRDLDNVVRTQRIGVRHG